MSTWGALQAQQDAQENQLAQARFASGMQNLSNTLAQQQQMQIQQQAAFDANMQATQNNYQLQQLNNNISQLNNNLNNWLKHIILHLASTQHASGIESIQFSRWCMPVSSYYQPQPDGYVRFDWRGNSLEGEFSAMRSVVEISIQNGDTSDHLIEPSDNN